ncbi:MAG: Sir2 family NAD-dependent protein deacetylase, partial [Acidimicrobiales bacterium]
MTVRRAADLLARARSGLALTGAGVSAESGIPTFRGEGGLWKKFDPVKVASIDYFLADPGAYWNVSRERGRIALAARPNPGHAALAELEAAGHLSAIVTQNTDGLHQDSGSKRVIEVHGSGRTVQCLDCGFRESRSEVQARLEVEMPPRCPSCGGIFLKPTVVLFGEAMPQAAVQEAFALA